jgi:copper chaperone CopZ
MKLCLTLVALLSVTSAHADLTRPSDPPSRLLSERPITKSEALAKCVPIEMGASKLDCVSCKVTGIEELGNVSGTEFAIASYEYFWAPETGFKNCAYGSVLLKRIPNSSNVQPLWGSLSDLSPSESEKPKIIQNNGRSLIQIPIRAEGTGHYQNDGILAWQDGVLHEVNATSYESELASHLPPELSINKGIYPDYKTMTVETSLWKKDDPNCCPTGGKITARLGLKNDKVVVESYHLKPDTIQ